MKQTEEFPQILYEKMKLINAGISNLEFFEFNYALENLLPKNGWNSIELDTIPEIENKINDSAFYESIKLKSLENDKPIIDDQIVLLNQMIIKGIVEGHYPLEWVNKHFFFDLRSFYFFHKTKYFNQEIEDRLGGSPYQSFKKQQYKLTKSFDLGYKVFKKANEETDTCFIDLIKKIVAKNRTPLVIGIAGQTAAGKTEIVARIKEELTKLGLSFTSLEIDHFLTDRDEREANGIDSLGKEALHFELFTNALKKLRDGNKITIPQYDFVKATSSHTTYGKLKDGCVDGEVESADLIFIEGNFPFLYLEVAQLIDLKVMYLTDDEIRLKRKWKRDIDYRKKYDFTYFVNRYFREQYLMAEAVYIPQMKKCDLLVDTTGASIWTTPLLREFYVSEKM